VHPGLVVNSVGSGESFVAGLLHSWRLAGDWAKAIGEGIAVATGNATTVRAGDIDPSTLPEWREHTTVEAVA
jgi:fructose-1-phosphate kinase PfkB-like protein